MIREGNLSEVNSISELGIYGTFVRKGNKILLNQESGHLVRTKACFKPLMQGILDHAHALLYSSDSADKEGRRTFARSTVVQMHSSSRLHGRCKRNENSLVVWNRCTRTEESWL